MKRKQVLAITPLGSTLIVENESEQSGRVETYVMKRFATNSWTATEEQEALGAFDRLIDFDPPIRHLVRHHSVIVQRGHINLVISHHARGGLQQYIAEQRTRRLSGIPGASANHNCAVAPTDCRAWFVMAATSVLDTHGRGMIHGNCSVGNLLCADTNMSSSEDNAPAIVLGAPHPRRHILAHYNFLRDKAPALVDCCIAPEVTKGQPHTEASDAYLLGVLMADLVLLASLGSPFAPDELQSTNPAAKAAAMGDSSFRKYVLSLLNEDAALRPTIKELLAAIPLLDWNAAVQNAGVTSPAARSIARSGSGSGRAASPQPHSPVRNASPTRHGIELFPVTAVSPASAGKRRSQSADSPALLRRPEDSSASIPSASEALPIDPQGSAPTTPTLNRRPRGVAASSAAAGEPRMHEWQRRATESMNEIERAIASARDGTGAYHGRFHHATQRPPNAPETTPLAVEPTAVARKAPVAEANVAAVPRSSSQGATHRAPQASRGPVGTSSSAVAAQAPPPPNVQPLSHHTLRLMTKSERMRALEEHGKLQSVKSAQYEQEKEKRALLTAQLKREEEERMRQHRQHIQQIKTDKAARRAAFDSAANRRAVQSAGPNVEIFVHTPSRGGGAKQWTVDSEDGAAPAPEVVHDAVATSKPAIPSRVAADKPKDTPPQEGLFFVPLERRSVRRSSDLQAKATSPLSSNLAATQREALSLSPHEDDATRTAVPDAASVPAPLFVNDAFDEAVNGEELAAPVAPTTSEPRRSNSRRSGAGSAARYSTRTSDLFSSTDEEDVDASTRSPVKPGPAHSTTSANHGVAHPPPGMLSASLSSPSPNPMSASKLPRPDTRGLVSAQPNTSLSSVELDRSANVGHTHPHQPSPAVNASTGSHTSHSASSAAITTTAAGRRAKNDRHADSELVSVVEWNVDLIVRQLRRYMDSDVLEEALQLCRGFARGATEARTNPRANSVLMARLSIVIGNEAMADCGPLISQFIALDATLATAEQLRSVGPLQ